MANIADQIKVKQDTTGMLHRALERIIQLYTDKSHFVYELLQNAEDCEATHIKFVQHDRYLEVMHNGKPFTETNLSGLCDIGQSDKAGNLNQIGEFGVGFKSVYGICDTVRLFSKPANYRGKEKVDSKEFAVQIDGFITPHDIDDEDMPKEYTTRFVFLYSVGRDYSGFNSVDNLNSTLTRKLSDLGITTLLFMKNLELIEYEILTKDNHSQGQYSLDKKVINDHCILVSASGSSSEDPEEEKLHFIKFSRPINDGSSRTVDIAFPVRKNSKTKEYIFQKSSDPYVSVYFPTETESKLDFIVQGPFRTTPNRTSIPADDKDNIRFAEETAILLRDALVELRDKGIFNMSLLRLMPLDPSVFVNSPLFKPLHNAVKDLLSKGNMLPCREGGYTRRENARIARQEKLPELFPDPVLTELINDGNEYHWLPAVLTETNREYSHVYRFLVGPEMKVPYIRPDDLRKLFSDNEQFLPTRSDDWLVELYSVLENIPSVFSRSKNESNMLTCEFIKTTKGTFVAPYRRVDKQYIPNIFIHTSKVSSKDINFVDETIYRRCKIFFDSILSITKPDEYEYFINSFKKRYCITLETETTVQIDLETHIEDICKLIKFSKNPDYSQEVTELIRNYLLLLCDDGIARRPGNQQLYIPETENGIKIKQYYKNISKNKFYIDLKYYYEHGITESDLSVLGVKDSIVVSNSVGSFSIFSRDFTIDLIENALLYISKHPTSRDSIEKSQAILKELLNNDSKLTGSTLWNGEIELCKAIRVLHGNEFKEWDGRWIYLESLELVSPRKISKYDIPSSLYGEINLNSNLFDLLDFKQTVKDEVEIITRDLTKKQRDAIFDMECQQRFGMSYAELQKQYGSKSSTHATEEKEILQFPVVNLRNWESLKKHAAEMLAYARPVEYVQVLRSIRSSKNADDARAYVLGMYRYPGQSGKYACQMCHEPAARPEHAELFNKPETELDPVNLCLCPNCAAEYRKLRNDEALMRQFKEKITTLRDSDITDDDTVAIPLGDYTIWFTQTHIAEIKLLIKYEKEAKSGKIPKPESEEVKQVEEPEETSDSIDFSGYIGKKLYRNSDGTVGIIKAIDNEYITLDVIEGPKEGQQIFLKPDILFDVSGKYKIK